MEKQWINATPSRERRTLFTVLGSVLLHGSIVAVAALYPVRYATLPDYGCFDPAPPVPPIRGEEALPPVDVLPLPPTANDPNLPSPAEPQPPVVTAISNDPPPPTEDPFMVDPALPKPSPKTAVRKSSAPRSSASIAVHGTLGAPAGAVTGTTGVAKRWLTPQPPYPYAVRAAHVQGSGSVRITTDGSGRVTNVSVAQSTGNALLDDNTSQFARQAWSGPPNASVTVPITYQMH